MQEVYEVPVEWSRTAKIDAGRYNEMHRASLNDGDAFWLDQAARLDWLTFPTRADESCFDAEGFGVRWFADGRMNVSANCLDRHLQARGDAVAIIWEPDDPSEPARQMTYRELHDEVCRLANVLKSLGVAKGDRVTVYMPMMRT